MYYSICCLDGDDFHRLSRAAGPLPTFLTSGPDTWLYRVALRYREALYRIYGNRVPIELLILLDGCHQVHLDLELQAVGLLSRQAVRRVQRLLRDRREQLEMRRPPGPLFAAGPGDGETAPEAGNQVPKVSRRAASWSSQLKELQDLLGEGAR
jgi:hypothetical protein